MRRELVEVRARDLRFMRDETTDFLRQELAVELTEADIAAFRTQQGQAFEEERERWRVAGLAEYVGEPAAPDDATASTLGRLGAQEYGDG